MKNSKPLTMTEIAAVLRIAAAAERGDVEAAQTYARTNAALSARGKLRMMREALSEPEEVPKVNGHEPEEIPPPKRYKRIKWGADRGES